MCSKILYIFQEKCFGAVFFYYFSDVKKKISLLFIFKPMFPSQTILFANSCNGKWLTRKAATKQIKLLWDIAFCLWFSNIAKRNLTKICSVCLLSVFVPLRAKN